METEFLWLALTSLFFPSKILVIYMCFCTHFVFRITYINIWDKKGFFIFDVFDLVGVFFNRMKTAN